MKIGLGRTQSEKKALDELRRQIEAFIVEQRRLTDLLDRSEELRKTEMRGTLLQTVETLDKLDRWLTPEAVAAANADESASQWVGRLEIVSRLLTSFLSGHDVVRMDLDGEMPPGTISILDRVKTPDTDHAKIQRVVEAGWYWGPDILRKAAVIVALPEEASNVARNGEEKDQ